MKIAIEHYLVTNNPNGVQDFLKKYGMPAFKTVPDGISKLRHVMKHGGNSVAKDLANIETPYKSMILSATNTESKSNACGCSGADGEQKSNCSGGCSSCACNQKTSNVDAAVPAQTAPAAQNVVVEEKKDGFQKYAPMVGLGLLVVIATTLLVKNG